MCRMCFVFEYEATRDPRLGPLTQRLSNRSSPSNPPSLPRTRESSDFARSDRKSLDPRVRGDGEFKCFAGGAALSPTSKRSSLPRKRESMDVAQPGRTSMDPRVGGDDGVELEGDKRRPRASARAHPAMVNTEPESTRRPAPLMKLARSEHRKATAAATSSGPYKSKARLVSQDRGARRFAAAGVRASRRRSAARCVNPTRCSVEFGK